MLKLFLNKKAQNTMEYALLIAIVVGAFTGMQLYLRRSLQLRIKSSTDTIPGMVTDNFNSEEDKTGLSGLFVDQNKTYTSQYEPYYTRKGKYEMTTDSGEGIEYGASSEKGGLRRVDNAVTKRAGTQGVLGPMEPDKDK